MAGNEVKLTFIGDSKNLDKTFDKVGKDAEGLGKKISGKTAGMVAGGAALGAGLMAGFESSLEFDKANAKLQAQMGAGSQAAEDAGAIAGKLYAGAYGDNIGEVNDAVRMVMQSGAVMEDATNDQIQSITGNILSMSDAFGQDTTASINAVSQMMKTGLAPNADAALDILTRGFQQGNDKAGDLLDTFNEYGTQFRKLGLDGTDAMGLISQGLKGGARDADVVADALKEFSIRAIDGSKSTADGFKKLGLSGADMGKKIAKGGKDAKEGLRLTLDKLREIKDPAERAATATELFGTQSEDLGDALYALDLDTAAEGMGDVAGAAQKVNDTLGETASSKIESAKRGFQEWRDSLIGVQGPLGDVATTVFTFGGDALEMAGSIGIAAVGLKGMIPDGLKDKLKGAAGDIDGLGSKADGAAGKIGKNGKSGMRGALGGLKAIAGGLALAGVGLAIDDVNTKAAGGAENLKGQAKELHGFMKIVKGDFTDLEHAPDDIDKQWNETVENWKAGRAPIQQVFNDIFNSGTTAATGIQLITAAKIAQTTGNWDGLKQFVINSQGAIKDAAGKSAGGVEGSFRSATGNITGWWGGVRAAISQPIGVSIIATLAQNSLNNIRAAVQKAIPKFHDGGIVGGAPGSEQLAILQAGERVIPNDAMAVTSGGSIHFTGSTDSAFASAFMMLVRSGKIQVR